MKISCCLGIATVAGAEFIPLGFLDTKQKTPDGTVVDCSGAQDTPSRAWPPGPAVHPSCCELG